LLSVIHVERIEDCLRAVSALVDAQQRRDVDFPRRVLEWLTTAEGVLQDARQASLSQVSALRSNLLAAHHAARRDTGQSRRAFLEATASEVIGKGQGVLGSVIEPRLTQIAEAEQLVSRVLAVGAIKGLLAAVPSALQGEARLRDILARLKSDADTMAATAHFLGLLGPIDALVVLDRALSLGHEL
jgi:hypothetical protein